MKIGSYTLIADTMNIILTRNTKGYFPNYFATVGNALQFMVDEGVRESRLTDLKTVVAKQDELYQLIKSLPVITPDMIVLAHKKSKGAKNEQIH